MATLNGQTRDSVTVHDMTAHILAVYDGSDSRSRRNGATWYGDAQHVAHVLAATATARSHTGHRYVVTVDVAAGIIAALSPRMRWGANVTAAHAIANGRPVVGLSRSIAAATAILEGTDWRAVLRGPKTRAFAAAVASGGLDTRYGAVCDAWAVRAATAGAYDSVAKCRYDDVARAYADAAAMRGINVHALQAIVWTVVRGSHQ